MGKWMEEYGEILLAGVAGFMVLMLILTSGILSVIGARMKFKENTRSQYEDCKILAELCQREKPKILYDTERCWYAGEVISIQEAFWGEDADGRKLGVEVKEITDRNGSSCMESYDSGTQQVIFQKAGIYMFELEVSDQENLCVTKKIQIPVDNRRVAQ